MSSKYGSTNNSTTTLATVCNNNTRRHLVMPSLRSLVANNNTTNTSRSQTPISRTMGASSSTSAPPTSSDIQEAVGETTSSRLIAPRLPKRTIQRDASCGSLLLTLTKSTLVNKGSTSSFRKCETVLALSTLDGIKPINRLRSTSSQSQLCSRCSSVMSMQQNSSRVSLNTIVEKEKPQVLCKICLIEVPIKEITSIIDCGCTFCTECLTQYVSMEVNEAAYNISCPDANCPSQGVLSVTEVESLLTPELIEKHRKFRLNTEVDNDNERVWCPRAGCETACRICPGCTPSETKCPTCSEIFCSICKEPWHPNKECSKQPFDDLVCDPDKVKRCPVCTVPIEKVEGCAQMMCKRCKHVFCWYCLASLDDDFLLRHYDKGPCKNKLGHSRASVIWHRTQVLAIFAGFGILLLVASPLLLLAAPCIFCCKCRDCQEHKSDQE